MVFSILSKKMVTFVVITCSTVFLYTLHKTRLLNPLIHSFANTRNTRRIFRFRQTEKGHPFQRLPACHRPEIGNDSNAGLQSHILFKQSNMSTVEELIFGNKTTEIHTLINAINMLERVIKERYTHTDREKLAKTMEGVLLNDSVLVDDYIYTPGGHWIPAKCTAKWKVAVIIPFRDRHYQLPILLRHLVPFLQRQHLEFRIFVPEQANNLIFNKGMLMNIGFMEALNFSQWDCFIFHDVDHVPIHNGNYYGCEQMPRHLQSGVDVWEYKLPYDTIFGGAIGLTRAQFIKVNGFSNAYWGWGGEDDDIYRRIKYFGFNRTRPVGTVGYYDVVGHHKQAEKNKDRWCLLLNAEERIQTDGLTNLWYPKPKIKLQMLYTNVSVDISPLKLNSKYCQRYKNTSESGNIRGVTGEDKMDLAIFFNFSQLQDEPTRL